MLKLLIHVDNSRCFKIIIFFDMMLNFILTLRSYTADLRDLKVS